MEESRPVTRIWHYWLLWAVAILALVLNVVLVSALLSFRADARRQVEATSMLLDEVELGSFELPVEVDESLQISMTVPFSDTFTVPISATIPVSTSVLFEDEVEVPINTIIPVNTTIDVPIDIPVIGLFQIPIPIPIRTNIPVNLTVNVPISREIPVETEIPVDLVVEVPVQSDIPIETEIPVQLEFPVNIPLNEMGFQTLVEQVQQALQLLSQMLGAG
jgi:hypothetical protein